MKEYRITKYNPKYRNELGHFIRGDWTSYNDIGKICNDVLITYEDYLKVENQYINTIVEIMSSLKMNEISLVEREKNHTKLYDKKTTKEMKRLNRKLKRRNAVFISEIPDLCRLILREYAWAKIESKKMFVHFCYDYYMYIGLEEQYEYVIDKVKYIGLFIEQMESPYK